MNTFLVTVTLFAVCATLAKAAVTKEEMIKKLMEDANECSKTVGSAPSDLDEMLKKMPASTKEGKCLRACLMQKYGAMNASGKFDKATSLKNVEKMVDGDPEKMKVAQAIGDACEGVAVPDDHCEAAEIYGKCLKEQFAAHGAEMSF